MKKTVCILLALVLVLGLFGGCVQKTPAADPEPEQTPTKEPTNQEKQEEAPPTEEPEKEPEEEPVVVIPKLNGLTVDGGYTLSFDPEINAYTVQIPAGRPRIPQISATAEAGAEVSLLQATISDAEISGTAKATVTMNGTKNEYTVEFVKDRAAGFQLQYADNFVYTPDYTLKDGEKFGFASSDSATVSVSADGTLSAKKVSENPVTVTISVNGKAVEELVIDRVIKAPLNIFLIMGQSNAFGWHDVPAGYSDYYAYANTQKALCDAPVPGTVWCDDIVNSYDEYSFSGIYDLSKGRSGFSPALGKEWYALTGEKTLMLQTAIGSTPIETWVPDPALKFFGLDCYAQTVERFNYYRDLYTQEASNFEINRIYGFWLQGETCEEYIYSSDVFTWAFKNNTPNYSYIGDWKSISTPADLMTSKQYSDYFLDMVNGFAADVGMEFIGILPVRAMYSVATRENREEQQLVNIVPVRAAQFALNYAGNAAISFVTLETEIGRTESYPDQNAEGWGYMGCNNIHYNQRGYNALGKDTADNTFAKFSAKADHAASEIVILDSNGKTRLEEGAELKVSVGESHQITGLVLPLYTDASALTFEIADASVCTIDEFGMIYVPNTASCAGKTTTLTVSNGELSKTVTIRIAR